MDQSLLSIILCLLICLFGHSFIQALRTQRRIVLGPPPWRSVNRGRDGEQGMEGVLPLSLET